MREGNGINGSHFVLSRDPKLSAITLQASSVFTPSTPITKVYRLAAVGSTSSPRLREKTPVLSNSWRTKQEPRSCENLRKAEGD